MNTHTHTPHRISDIGPVKHTLRCRPEIRHHSYQVFDSAFTTVINCDRVKFKKTRKGAELIYTKQCSLAHCSHEIAFG